ncbi:MAG: hypothetical protein ACI4GV_01845 [Acutalibacteraceae bacterium]
MNFIPLIVIGIGFLFIYGAGILCNMIRLNRKKQLKNKKSLVGFGLVYGIAIISFVSYIVFDIITVQTRAYGDNLEIIYTGSNSMGHYTKCYLYDENNVIQDMGEIQRMTIMGDNALGNRFKAQKEGKSHIIALDLVGGESLQKAELYIVSVDSNNNISYKKQKTETLYEFYNMIPSAKTFVAYQSKKYNIDKDKYYKIWDTLLTISGKIEVCETPDISNEDSLTFMWNKNNEDTIYRETTMYFQDDRIYCHNNIYDYEDNWYCFYVDDYVNVSRIFDTVQELK